jgi:hypothetical protein
MTRPDFTRAGPRVASMSDALESRSSMDEMLHLANRVIEGESRRQKLSSVAKLLRYVNHLSEAESRSDCRIALLRTATLFDMCVEDDERDAVAMLRRIRLRAIPASGGTPRTGPEDQ